MVVIRRSPAPALRKAVSAYHGFESDEQPTRRHEGPGADIVLLLTLDHGWRIDGQPRTSFAAGLRTTCVETESRGGIHGIQIDLAPWAARALLGVPLHELAGTSVPPEELLPDDLPERVAAESGWRERFALVDWELGRRLADGPPPAVGVVFAWERLRTTHGTVRIEALAQELGWSRKRLAAGFREHVGLTPKATGRLLRFARARALAGTMGWSDLAFACGYADQPHLIAEFRAFTGRTPETFLQDETAAAV